MGNSTAAVSNMSQPDSKSKDNTAVGQSNAKHLRLDVEQKPKHGISQTISGMKYLLLKLFSVPTPGLRNSLPIFGGKTLFEVIIMIAVTVITIAVSISAGAETAGVIADLLFAILVLFGLRHNILNIIFGVSFERALYFHKLLVLLGLSATAIHGIGLGANTGGFVLVALIMSTGLIYFTKNTSFELFYYLHVAIYVCICPIAYMHGAFYFPIAGKTTSKRTASLLLNTF